ncbi:MAG TPA: pyridoxamine 5'-phosphate oxidase family protein [Steroidobacteraceae bacterium]|nr:pyridoxamine 5'-phosphate oxidase family protein [Steroidobacteraceae bacterium]
MDQSTPPESAPSREESVFHADELAAQALAGVRARSAGIRNVMTDQHRSFFAALPHILIATPNAEGWPLAALLEGEPGFVESPDPTTLRIRALPPPDDPAAGTLSIGVDVAILGIDLATRRRNRANGVVSGVDASGFTVAVRQSFGNCPQYIQRRALRRMQPVPGRMREFESLADEDARALIAKSDTFFVASHSRAGMGTAGGADISHRGGRPGFVRVTGNTLSIPDFRGNRYFNTLGNFLGEPRSSLLFLDFETGDLLQLQGLAAVDWSASTARPYEGAERIWHFQVRRGRYRERAAALRGAFLDYSPVTLRTGTWEAHAKGLPRESALAQDLPAAAPTSGGTPSARSSA